MDNVLVPTEIAVLNTLKAILDPLIRGVDLNLMPDSRAILASLSGVEITGNRLVLWVDEDQRFELAITGQGRPRSMAG